MSTTNGEEGAAKAQNTFAGMIEQLYEKRASERESGYARIGQELRLHYTPEALAGCWETIADLALKSLRRGGAKEARNAAQVLSLIALTLGPNQRVYGTIVAGLMSFLDEAQRTADMHEDGKELGVTAGEVVKALGSLCFFSSENPEDRQRCIRLFHTLVADKASFAPMAAAAAAQWAVLRSTIHATERGAAQMDAEMLPSLVALLESTDVDARIEAGIALALLFEQNVVAQEVVAGIRQHMNEVLLGLANSATHAKNERVKEQPVFRKVIKTVIPDNEPEVDDDGEERPDDYAEDDEDVGAGEDAPEEVLTIKFQQVAFTGWSEVIQLYKLRDALSTGLLVHLEENDALHTVVGIKINKFQVKEHMSAIEKRLTVSPCSRRAKEQSVRKGRGRDTRSVEKNQILDDN